MEFGDQILLQLIKLNRKQQLANEIAYQQLRVTNHNIVVNDFLMGNLNERLDES